MTPPRYILAPYVATPPEIVERMLDLGDVGEGDVLYDLGCGDGRIAIAAARRGARAVGIDIEPHWIEESRAAAQAAGVAGLARFEVGDALDWPLREATVVCVYLVEWSTQRVLDRLRETCAPGTRVVSHSFAFETHGACTQQVMDAEGNPRRLHLLVLGAG